MESTLSLQFDVDQKLLLEAINVKYNYDFREYSGKSMKRMLIHAMNRMGCPSLTTLHEKVIQNADSFHELIQSLTVPVSEMFRDPSYYLALRNKVIPLLKTYPSIRVWVAGCSTGEEVYSIAILLEEEDLLDRATMYATDINPRVLDLAEKGVWPLAALEKFNQNYIVSGGKRKLSDYYTVGVHSATFARSLIKNVTFADHSLVTDAVFAETHLISCRNVLIYFNRALQDKAIGLFRESLCRKGFLGLGCQETIQLSKYANDFDIFEKKERVFRKK